MTRAYCYPGSSPLVNGVIGDVVATSFEHQNIPIILDSLNGADSFSIDTGSPLSGGACIRWNRAAGSSVEAFRYSTILSGVGQSIMSSSFGLRITTGPPTSKYVGFHAFNGAAVYFGVGIYTDGSGNLHIALISGDTTLTIPNVPWNSTNTLTANTYYRICWKNWRTSQGASATDEWMGDLILMDSSGAFIERSGPIRLYTPTVQPATLDNPAFGGWGNGSNHGLSSAIDYRIDDLVVTKGGWAPLYTKFVSQVPTGTASANTQGTDTAWVWIAGGTNNDEFTTVDELPNDGDTSYIGRTATGSASQTYLPTATGVSLAAGEMVIALSDFVCVTYVGGTAPTYVTRGRIGGLAKNGTAHQGAASTYAWAKGIWTPPITSWTISDVDNGEIGINTSGGTSTDRRCTTILREVAYGKDMYDNMEVPAVLNPSDLHHVVGV